MFPKHTKKNPNQLSDRKMTNLEKIIIIFLKQEIQKTLQYSIHFTSQIESYYMYMLNSFT
jgi:hypothetical protein